MRIFLNFQVECLFFLFFGKTSLGTRLVFSILEQRNNFSCIASAPSVSEQCTSKFRRSICVYREYFTGSCVIDLSSANILKMIITSNKNFQSLEKTVSLNISLSCKVRLGSYCLRYGIYSRIRNVGSVILCTHRMSFDINVVI